MSATIHWECPAFGPCRLVRARGVEAMNALPRWEVDLLAEDPDVDLDALVRTEAALVLEDGAHPRPVPLLVTHASYAGPARDGHRFAVELSAMAWPLRLRRGYRIFQKKAVQEIVAEVLRDAGVATDQVVWRLAGKYTRRVQCVQHAEDEWAFLERLLADEGIFFWFDAEEAGPRLVLGDSAGAHEGIAGELVVPFVDASGMASSEGAFSSLRRVEEITPDAVHLRDYDERHPDVLVEGKAGTGSLEVFEYPARVPHAEAAAARAQVRLEQLQRVAISVRGRSGCARLQPGRVVRIDGADDEGFDGEWLVVEVTHEMDLGSQNAASGAPYRNEVLLVPRRVEGKERVFRPAPPASRPRIEGLETAVVTGPPGEEIHVDDMGCVKLALPWDPSGILDASSSRWARTLQMNMGGSMLLPRVGWEVAVGYVNGNPDGPFVLGQVYNAVKAPPYPLPAHKATSSLQSGTSPGGGSVNEIRMGDTGGGQEMYIHASNTQSVGVGASATTKVGANETHDVNGGCGVHVGSQTVSVGGSQKVAVGSDVQTQVKGARTEVVGAVESIGVKASHRVQTGSYSEVVGALYGIQCNATATMVSGPLVELVGGNLVQIAGLGTHESVAGARTELVAGARNMVAAIGCEDETWGAKLVSVGAAKENAGGNVETAAATGAINVSGSARITAGGKIQIEAASITIEAASLTMGAGASAKLDGNLGLRGGTTKLDAPVTKRKSGAKVEG